jgi:hypothetical protein
VANSSFLDFTDYRIASDPSQTSTATIESAYGVPAADIVPLPADFSVNFNVAIVLQRQSDPTTTPAETLLAEHWAARQATLDPLIAAGTLWTTYGANAQTFAGVEADIQSNGFNILDSTDSNYTSSAASQTIWVQINTAQDFQNFFGTSLDIVVDKGNPADGLVVWNGNLNLARLGMTMITVTHEMGFARRVADLVVFMLQGRVWEIGPTAELFAHPRTAEFTQFIGSEL